MAALERNALPSVGGAFWREDGEVMFRFVIDSGNIVGPRVATAADRANHPVIYRAFSSADNAEAATLAPEAPTVPALDLTAESDAAASLTPSFEGQEPIVADAFNGADPAKFDHDGDGRPGGSLRVSPAHADEAMIAAQGPQSPAPAPTPKRKYTKRKG